MAAVTEKDLGEFAQAVADRLEDGQSMPEALALVAASLENQTLAEGVRRVVEIIDRDGDAVGWLQPFHRVPEIFSADFLQAIDNAGMDGRLAWRLRQYAQYCRARTTQGQASPWLEPLRQLVEQHPDKFGFTPGDNPFERLYLTVAQQPD